MLKSSENLPINDVSGSNSDESESAAVDNTNKMDTGEKYVMSTLEDTDDGEGNASLLRELGVLKKTSLLRKDFKTKGQILEVGQRTKSPMSVSCIRSMKQNRQAMMRKI